MLLYDAMFCEKFSCNVLHQIVTARRVITIPNGINIIRVFHDKEILRISVRISGRSKVTQNKINFVKNCPQWGLNSQPPDHQSRTLPTVLARNLLEICAVSFLLFHAPLYMLDFVYFLNQ